MAALNSGQKARLGPKATQFLQDTLHLCATPEHENVDAPDDLIQAMENLSLNSDTNDTTEAMLQAM